MMRLNELTIKEASAGLRQKKFSVTELVSDCLEAIRGRDEIIHGYLEVFDDVMVQAKRADEQIQQSLNIEMSNFPPLFGIPLAIKDNILIEGKKCTAGSRILESYAASYDATVISKLKKQGAIFLGKTNLDEFAMGSSTENSAFGPSRNPHDADRVPGGSSGGSAVAVAANLCIAALGSDTGGSIRQPASFCGIAGLKPTYGRVSRHGLIAMASSLDQIGPMTKTVEDAEILFNVIAGSDNFDSTAVSDGKFEIRNSKFEIPENLKDLRIGIPKEYFGSGLDLDIKEKIEALLKKIEQEGVKIAEITLPHSEYALPTYYIVVPSEVSANLARYDGIRYGVNITANRQLSTANLYEVYTKTRASYLGNEVKRRIMLGTYALSAGYYDAYYLKAQKVRTLIAEDFKKAFEKVDVILGPTTPTPAFKFGERTEDPVQMYLADIYTVAINLAGLPGISIPGGWITREGKNLPFGVQLIAPHFEENKLFSAAKFIESIC